MVPSPRWALIYTSTMVQFIQCTVHFHHILPEDNRAERRWNGCFTEASPSPFHLQHVTLCGWIPFISSRITIPKSSSCFHWYILRASSVEPPDPGYHGYRDCNKSIWSGFYIFFLFVQHLFPFDPIFSYIHSVNLMTQQVNSFMSVKASRNKDFIFRIEQSVKRGTRWHLGHIVVFSQSNTPSVSARL